jgi:hypothetical protein
MEEARLKSVFKFGVQVPVCNDFDVSAWRPRVYTEEELLSAEPDGRVAEFVE